MSKLFSVRHMNAMCGLNKSAFRVGKALTVAGLVIAATGFALTARTVSVFDRSEYEVAHEFVDAVLG